jgi:predicted  nucleic acid-binding Zn-ribbon protein
MNAKSAHEVTSLQRDIDGITKSRGELDEAILNFMDETETCAGKLDALRAKVHEVMEMRTEVETRFAQDAARLDDELKEVLAQRQTAAPALSEEETEHYDATAKRHGGIAVTWNEKGNCAACGMTLTPYNLKEARTEDWPQCESCGRLLYIEAV